MATKKKTKDLTPKGKSVKGGAMGRDMDRLENRDVKRLKRNIQKTGQGLGKDVQDIPK